MRSILMAGAALALLATAGCGADKAPEQTAAAPAASPAPAPEAPVAAISMADQKPADAPLPSAQAGEEVLNIEIPLDTEKQKSNRGDLFGLLDTPYSDDGLVMSLRMPLAAGGEVDVWAGPVMRNDAGTICRIVMVGELAPRRVDQSFPACKVKDADWVTTYDPATLNDESRELLTSQFKGDVLPLGMGADPYPPK